MPRYASTAPVPAPGSTARRDAAQPNVGSRNFFSVYRMNGLNSPALQPAPATIRTTVNLPIRLHSNVEAHGLVHSFHGLVDGKEHIALQFGKPVGAPLVRIHSECLTGDVFGSMRCDCGPQLQEVVTLLSEKGGYLLYLRQEGRGIGLYAKLDAYRLQEEGHDTFAANLALGHGLDDRNYTVAAQMLGALGVSEIELISNNPDKRTQLEDLGIKVTACRRTGTHLNAHNRAYLHAKVARSNHALTLDEVI